MVHGMHETAADLAELQALLDRSIASAGRHLISIVEPGRRTITAGRLVAETRTVCVLNVATTTTAGEPRLSAVDGHFRHGHWYFSTAASAVKAQHLLARAAVSVAFTPRDGFGVWAHGRATFLTAGSAEWSDLDDYLRAVYGQAPSDWVPDSVYVRVDPHWMVGFAMTAAELTQIETDNVARQSRIEALGMQTGHRTGGENR